MVSAAEPGPVTWRPPVRAGLVRCHQGPHHARLGGADADRHGQGRMRAPGACRPAPLAAVPASRPRPAHPRSSYRGRPGPFMRCLRGYLVYGLAAAIVTEADWHLHGPTSLTAPAGTGGRA